MSPSSFVHLLSSVMTGDGESPCEDHGLGLIGSSILGRSRFPPVAACAPSSASIISAMWFGQPVRGPDGRWRKGCRLLFSSGRST